MGKRIERKIQILLRFVRQVVRGVACHAMFTTYDYPIGLKGAMSHNTHARANENKLEKDGLTFSSCVGDFGRLFLSV